MPAWLGAKPALAAGFSVEVAVEVKAITLAGAGGIDGMARSCPGDTSKGSRDDLVRWGTVTSVM